MDNQERIEGEGLTADEKAYFDSKGEAAVAPAAEPAKADEVSADVAAEKPADEAPGDADKTKTVPHKAMHAEREKRKAAETELQKERVDRAAERARIDERLRIMQGLQQQAQQPKPQAIEIPDADADPVGFMKVLGQAVGALAQEKQQAEQRAEQQKKVQDYDTHLVNFYTTDAQRFAAETPDFKDAYAFVGQQRIQELFIMSGGTATAPQIKARLEQEEKGLAEMAMKTGKSPAAYLYELAKARGWQPKAATDEAAVKDDPAQKLVDVAAAQSANKSLSGTGGGSALTGEMTAAKLAALSEDDFAAWVDKNPKGFQRLAGG